jgi:hypothetical protein
MTGRLVIMAMMLMTACPKEAMMVDVAPAAMAALATRSERLHDFQYEATAVDEINHQTLRFRYAFQQPKFLAGTLLSNTGAETASYRFDGTHLAMIDFVNRQGQRRDLSGDEALLVGTVHEVFTPFSVEGWRALLVRPQQSTAVAVDRADGERWVITTPIEDDVLAKSVLTVRARTADFLSHEFIDRAGKVVRSIRVERELKDDATGLSFPQQWLIEGDNERQRLSITNSRINQGVDGTTFITTLPPGFVEPARGSP